MATRVQKMTQADGDQIAYVIITVLQECDYVS